MFSSAPPPSGFHTAKLHLCTSSSRDDIDDDIILYSTPTRYNTNNIHISTTRRGDSNAQKGSAVGRATTLQSGAPV